MIGSRRYPSRTRNSRKRSSSRRRVIVVLLALLLGIILLGLAAVGGVYFTYARDLPSQAEIEAILIQGPSQTTQIFDRNGRLLHEVFDPEEGRRTTVPLSRISPHLIQATLATEDADFYNNSGVNIRGIVRAFWENIKGRETLQGGSSITQQLVKNTLIPPEERFTPSYDRKIRELILAVRLTQTYSKEQILELYLNQIFYGNLAYGVEAAALNFFGKPAQDLNLAEAAMLAGLPQAPALYSPLANPEQAKARQAAVLDLMVRQGYINEEQANAAKAAKLRYVDQHFAMEAPHFVTYVRELLEKTYGADALYKGGLRVTTTIDLDLHRQAEEIARKHVETLQRNNARNAALVAIDPRTGEILAMLGSVDHWNKDIQGQVNMATAERQPGSAFKPFNYVTAFMRGYTPATMLLDIPSKFDTIQGPYEPENIDKKFRGPVSLRDALSTSLNVPAIRTIAALGVENVIDTAHRMGITTLNRKGFYGLSLTLGGGEVKLLDMVYAFSVFANEGRMAGAAVPPEERQPGLRELNPVAILKVTDAKGRVLQEFKQPAVKSVLAPQLAYLITNILSDNDARMPLFGPASPLKLADRPAAVKTGTTNDWKDNWTVGYTPQLAVGVWVGNADNTQMYESYGSSAAAPIWNPFMTYALRNVSPTPFTVPEGIATAEVCVPSGLLATANCAKTRNEVFIAGTAPTRTGDSPWDLLIDSRTGVKAGPDTPLEYLAEGTATVSRDEAGQREETDDPTAIPTPRQVPTTTIPTPRQAPTPTAIPPTRTFIPTPTPTQSWSLPTPRPPIPTLPLP